MKSFITILIVLCASFGVKAQADREIIAILTKQQNDWNRGDINAFMENYLQSDSLMFIGKNGVTYGWQNTLQRYLKGYPDKAAMGTLKFDILHIKKTGKRYRYVVGKWHLTRTAGDVGGHFTLLFKKINKTWVIISDHSS